MGGRDAEVRKKHLILRCLYAFWWIRRGSNSLPPPCHGGALPGELRTHSAIFIIH